MNASEAIMLLDPDVSQFTAMLMKLRPEDARSYREEWREDRFGLDAKAVHSASHSPYDAEGVQPEPLPSLYVYAVRRTGPVRRVSRAPRSRRVRRAAATRSPGASGDPSEPEPPCRRPLICGGAPDKIELLSWAMSALVHGRESLADGSVAEADSYLEAAEQSLDALRIAITAEGTT